jgi:glucose-6-phosphate 1-epimerase
VAGVSSDAAGRPLSPSARLVDGAGGLAMVAVRSDHLGSLDVYLHGAHVTLWVPPGGDPVLWLSPLSRYHADAAIRGGVPLCFPWFGGGPDDDLTPPHGPARLREWQLEAVTESSDHVEIVLSLGRVGDGGATGRPVDALAATYRVRLGRSLDLALEVRNGGEVPVTFEEALHTYLAVSDLRAVTVEGLAGADYLDRLGGPDPVRQEENVLRLSTETDRIYVGTPATVVVDDPGAARRLAVRKTGSASTVVWNPWAEKAAGMADLGAGWPHMLCVETANVRRDAVTLAPGARHTMVAELTVEDRA